MFVKLIVLILALGSTGVGVLSVRQARFEVSNEMTQSRLRERQLQRRAMELRSQISQSVTPSLIRQAIDASAMVHEIDQRIDLIVPVGFEPVVDQTPLVQEPDEGVSLEYWTLDDGTRVYQITDSKD